MGPFLRTLSTMTFCKHVLFLGLRERDKSEDISSIFLDIAQPSHRWQSSSQPHLLTGRTNLEAQHAFLTGTMRETVPMGLGLNQSIGQAAPSFSNSNISRSL
jgi:hypothetical protein